MAITYQNNFKNILDKVRSILRTEFKGALPVYIGHETKDTGTQYLRLDPISSSLLEYNISAETREFTIQMYYYFSEPNVNKIALDQVLRVTSRIEALIQDNITIRLADSSDCINCRVESTELNALDDENEYVVQFEWIGQHTGNIG